ncbi:MAG: hypothetical protein JNM93_07225 [Bacteriovoracaceae bacterium]|nr:hypothetical protein [Bacteriovoracaceae bacterium]
MRKVLLFVMLIGFALPKGSIACPDNNDDKKDEKKDQFVYESHGDFGSHRYLGAK